MCRNIALPSSFLQSVCISTVDGKSPNLSGISRSAEFTEYQHIGNGKRYKSLAIGDYQVGSREKFNELIACESGALEQQDSIGLHGKTEPLQLLVQ